MLPVGPWALAAIATVLVVALSVPPGGPRPATVRSPSSPIAAAVVAAIAGALFLLLAGVARFGEDSELNNPVPALVVGLGWPLLLLLPAVVGLPRRRADDEQIERGDVWPAVVAAAAVMGFLTLPYAPTRPNAVATALAAYLLVVLAACVAFGRGEVAARFEVLGLLASWVTLWRALPRWAAPSGALAVLAVVLGGAWFERYERTSRWVGDLPGPADSAVGLGVALVLAGLGAAALHLATRRGGSPGTAAAVLLPLVVGTAVAGVTRRALISAQLLADQAAGPRAIETDPLGFVGGQALALGLVAVGGALGGAVLARRMGDETARLPGLAVLLVLTGASAWLVLQV